jgi:general secretion pathway protein F
MSQALKRFSVEVISPAGERQHIERDALSDRDIALDLLGKGFTPVSISLQRTDWLGALVKPIQWSKGPRASEMAMFAEQMSEMLASGLTVEQALGVMGRRPGKSMLGKMAGRVLLRVRGGEALSSALAEEQVQSYLVGMVRAAEQSGQIAEAFTDAARYLQREVASRGKLANALLYPAIVLMTVLGVLAFVLGFVIPQFAPIFEGDEDLLPGVTRLVLSLSELVTHHGIWLVIGILLPVALAWLLRQSDSGRAAVGKIVSRLPVAHALLSLDLSKVLSVMGTLIKNGVEVSGAVTLCASVATSQALAQRMEDAGRKLREGGSVSGVFRSVVKIPETTLSIIEVGEHTGELGRAIQRAAYLLEMESERRINRLVALVNPIAIAFLGLVVGVVVAGVMLGIMSINQLAVR